MRGILGETGWRSSVLGVLGSSTEQCATAPVTSAAHEEVRLLLAVADEPELLPLLDAASRLCPGRVGPAAVDQMLESGLVVLTDDVVTLASDAAAPRMLERATPPQLRRAHEAWADALNGHCLAQARHRSLATRERSDSGAWRSIDAARRYQEAGKPERSLELLRKAAGLWVTPGGRSQSLVEAAATTFALGRPHQGRRLLRQAAEGPQCVDLEQISRALLSTFASHARSGPREPQELAAAAATFAAWEQPMLAFSVLADAGSSEEVDRTVHLLAGRRPAEHALGALARRRLGDFSSTLPLLIAAADQATDAGLYGVLTHLQTMIGELAVELGDQAGAQRALEVAHGLSFRTEQPRWGARTDVAQAMAAVLSDSPDQGRLVRHAHHRALCTGSVLRDRAELVEAVSLAAADRWTDAFDLLSRLAAREPREVAPLLSAGLLSLLADAAVHCGRRQEGRVLISRMAQVDTHCERDLELAELLYATAVLSEDVDAESCFQVALALDPPRLPWQRARTSLAYGSWLRRHRRVTESRTHLLEAHRAFEALDLPTWARRTQAELRASGMKAGVSRPAATRLDLSPQEFEITQLVARGLTNRQIGEALHLSPRTIGSHLYRIFPKLDVTSRTELAALVDATR